MSTQDEREDNLEIPMQVSMTFKPSGDKIGFGYKNASEVPSTIVITAMADIDELIDIFQDEIRGLSVIRQELMNRAISENITEDSSAILIEMPGKLMRNPITDIEKFANEFKQEYILIRNNQLSEIMNEYETKKSRVFESPINLTLADKIVGKDKVTRFVGTKPQPIQYKVMRKRVPGFLK